MELIGPAVILQVLLTRENIVDYAESGDVLQHFEQIDVKLNADWHSTRVHASAGPLQTL
jgi:hypothetical protein